MHIDVYQAIQLTLIVLSPILLRRNIFRSSMAGICWKINRMKLEAQNFSRARSASRTVGPEMRRKDFNKGPIRFIWKYILREEFLRKNFAIWTKRDFFTIFWSLHFCGAPVQLTMTTDRLICDVMWRSFRNLTCRIVPQVAQAHYESPEQHYPTYGSYLIIHTARKL